MTGDPSWEGDARDVIARLPRPWSALAEGTALAPLGGATRNRVVSIDAEGGRFVLRMPRAQPYDGYFTEERHNLRLAARWGLAPPILHYDPADGTLLAPFVEGEAVTARGLKTPALIGRVAACYAILHAGNGFRYSLDPFDRIRRRRKALGDRAGENTTRIDALGRLIADLQAPLQDSRPPPAACHNDPFPRNAIDLGARVVLVDWQVSGMGDPDFELAGLMNHARFVPSQEEAFVEAYDRSGQDFRLDRIRLMRPVSAYYFALARARAAADAPGDTKAAAQLEARLSECGDLLADPRLGQAARGMAG